MTGRTHRTDLVTARSPVGPDPVAGRPHRLVRIGEQRPPTRGAAGPEEEHQGRLERRLRSVDDRVEMHVVSFPDKASFAAYRNDPRRQAAAPLLDAAGAQVELFAVADVSPSGHIAPPTIDEGAAPG